MADVGDSGAWEEPGTVAGVEAAPPNPRLVDAAATVLRSRRGRGTVVDIGCGAARNALPLAQQGWRTFGIDSSRAMLAAAAVRAAAADPPPAFLRVAFGTMTALPLRSRAADLVVAHGIWNLAASAAVFRRAVREAARIARPGASLFVFTFARSSLPVPAMPAPGGPFVFAAWGGAPQCYLTAEELRQELAAAGFEPAGVVTEINAPRAGSVPTRGAPAFLEGWFVRQA